MNLLKNKIFQNASWIIISKIIQSVLGLVVSLLTARYLGPSNFGIINYAASLVTFVSPIVFLGINNVLVKEFSQKPEKEGQVLGTSLVMSLCSAIVCIVGIVSFSLICDAGQTETIAVTAIYSLILLFQVLDLVQYWFQAKLLSKYTAIVSLVAYICITVYKIFLLVTKKPVYWFAASNVLDYLLISLLLLIFYRKLGGQKLSFSARMAKEIFNSSKHYIVTGLMVAVFSQTDKIMLKHMIDETATGLYASATTIATLTAFVYAAIIDSFRPVIFQAANDSNEKFESSIVKLYSIIIYLSLLQAIVMTWLAKPIVGLLYGSQFLGAVSALRIIVWFNTFSYIGSIRNIWILVHEKQKYLWMINLSGAVLNVILNYFLIPIWGVNGAAFASLITQIFSNFILSYLILPIRKNNRLILQSLNPKYIYQMLKQ